MYTSLSEGLSVVKVLIELTDKEHAELTAVKDIRGLSWHDLLMTCRGPATANQLNSQISAFFEHLDRATSDLETHIRKDEGEAKPAQPGVA